MNFKEFVSKYQELCEKYGENHKESRAFYIKYFPTTDFKDRIVSKVREKYGENPLIGLKHGENVLEMIENELKPIKPSYSSSLFYYRTGEEIEEEKLPFLKSIHTFRIADVPYQIIASPREPWIRVITDTGLLV